MGDTYHLSTSFSFFKRTTVSNTIDESSENVSYSTSFTLGALNLNVLVVLATLLLPSLSSLKVRFLLTPFGYQFISKT